MPASSAGRNYLSGQSNHAVYRKKPRGEWNGPRDSVLIRLADSQPETAVSSQSHLYKQVTRPGGKELESLLSSVCEECPTENTDERHH